MVYRCGGRGPVSTNKCFFELVCVCSMLVEVFVFSMFSEVLILLKMSRVRVFLGGSLLGSTSTSFFSAWRESAECIQLRYDTMTPNQNLQ